MTYFLVYQLICVFLNDFSQFGTIEGFVGVLEDVRPKWFVRPGPQVCRLGLCAFPFLLGFLMIFDVSFCII